MFRGSATSLKTLPKDGDQVIIYGNLTVYPPSGKYQIVALELRYAGLGELLLKLEELKHKLHKRGWFSKKYKKPIPKFPKRIGVVTSPTGAAIQDILNILNRRFSGFHLILNPVRVQGEGAAKEIAQAINTFNTYNMVDVMIVGRGGGSIEDLWAFNEELVAEAIFNSRIPIISAVGHETDHCIADYVADVRAPTPSAAAEIVISEKTQQLHHLLQTQTRLNHAIQHQLRHYRHRLEGVLRLPYIKNPLALVWPWMQKLDDARQAADFAATAILKQKKLLLTSREKVLQSLKPTTQIAHFRHRFLSLKKQIDMACKRGIATRKDKLGHLTSALKSIDPKNLLSKGYSILFSEKERSVISSVRSVRKEQAVRVLLCDGEISSTVKEIYPHE